jgi:hypothetical protein
VITSQKEESSRVSDFICQKQTNGLYALLASIDIISYEEVLLDAIWVASDLKQSKQVEVLPMRISKYLDRRLDIQQHLLSSKDFSTFVN